MTGLPQPITGRVADLSIPSDICGDLFELARAHTPSDDERTWDCAIAIVFSALGTEAGVAVVDMVLRDRPSTLASLHNLAAAQHLNKLRTKKTDRTPNLRDMISAIGKSYGRAGIVNEPAFVALDLLHELRNEIAHAKPEQFKVFTSVRTPDTYPSLLQRVWSAAGIPGAPPADIPLATLFRRPTVARWALRVALTAMTELVAVFKDDPDVAYLVNAYILERMPAPPSLDC